MAGSRIRTLPLVIAVLLITADQSYGAFSISSTTGKPPRSTALPVATIDGAELFDGSFFKRSKNEDDLMGSSICVETSESPSNRFGDGDRSIYHASTANLVIEKISSSSLAWAAICAILSLSAVLNTQAIGVSLRILSAISSWYMTRLELAPLITKCITGGIVALIGDYGAQWFEYKSFRSKAITPSSADPAFALRAGGHPTPTKRAMSLSIHGTYAVRRGIARFLECLLISSPLMHYGYGLFESIMPVVGGAGIPITGSIITRFGRLHLP